MLARVLAHGGLILPFLPTLLFFLPPLLTDRIFFNEDLELYFYPLRAHLRQAFLAFDLPGWNPYASLGLPLLADRQLAAFYPPNVLFYLLPTPLAFTLSFALHFALGTWLGLAWLKEQGFSRAAQVFGTLVWMWSGFFWAHLHHATFLPTAVWLPGMLLACDRILASATPWKYAPLLAFPVGMASLAGGSPQLLYYGLLTVGAYLIWHLWVRFKAARAPAQGHSLRAALPAMLSPLSACLLATLLGLALAGVQDWPFYLATLEKYQEPISRLEFAGSFALHPLALGRMLVPELFGNDFYMHEGLGWQGPSTYWETWCYFGILTLPLVALSLSRRGKAGFFSGLLGLSFLASLGKVGGLHTLLVYTLPLFGAFRAPSRLIMLTGLAAAWLAAHTVDALLRGDIPQARIHRTAKFTLVLGLELWAVCALALFSRDVPLHPEATWSWLQAGVVVVLSWQVLRWAAPWSPEQGPGRLQRLLTPTPTKMARVLVGLLLLDLLPVLARYNHTLPAAYQSETPEVIQAIRAHIPAHERVLTDRTAPTWLLNAGSDYAVRMVRGYNPLNPSNLQRFLEASDNSSPREGGISLLVENLQSPMLGLLAPRGVLSEAELEPSRYEQVWQEKAGSLRLYRDRVALPRFWLTDRLAQEPNSSAALVHSHRINRYQPPEWILDELSPGTTLQPGSVQAGRLTLELDRPDEVVLTATVQGRAGLVLADRMARGWTATLNGVETPIRSASHVLRGVVLPRAGTYTVRFAYQVPGFRQGLGLTGLALALLLLWGLAGRRGRAAGAAGIA